MQSPSSSRPMPGYLLILVASCMWSLGGVFIKVLTQTYHVDPRTLACLRSVVAGLLLSWALPGIAKAPRWRTIGAGVSYTVVVAGFVAATCRTSAANAIFLEYAYPLFVAVGVVFLFSEVLGRRTMVALALGMAGIAVILFSCWTPGEREGLVYGLMSALGFAAFALLTRSMRFENAFALSSFINLTAGALLFLPAWGMLRISGTAFIILAAMAAVQLGIPYALFIKGMRTVPTTDAAIITLVEPILNPVWVWIFIGEVPHPGTLVGGVFIILALLVRFTGGRQASPRTGCKQPVEPSPQRQKGHKGRPSEP